MSDNDTAAGADLGLRTIDLARQTGDSVLEGFALDFALNVSFRARRFDAVEAIVAEILSGDTRRFGAFEATVLYQVGRLRLARGDVDDAGAVFERCERIALASGSAGGLGYALFGRCDVARRQGRWDDALALAGTCAELDQIVAPRELWMSLDRVARVGVRLGDEDAVASAVARFPVHHRHHRHHRRAALEAARGCLAHVRGSTDLAKRHLVDALEVVAEIGNANYFADLVDTLGFVTGVDLTETVRAVQDGGITPNDAFARLAR